MSVERKTVKVTIFNQTYSLAATLVLAGATDLGAIGRAVEKVERVVTTGSPDAAETPVP